MKIAYTICLPEAQTDRVAAWNAPLDQSAPALAQLGYDGIEIMIREPASYDGQAIQEQVRSCGLSISMVGTGPIAFARNLSLSSPDEARRQEAIRAAQDALRLCAQWGACMNIGQFRGRCPPHVVSEYVARFADSMRRIVPLAEDLHVRLCLEPQNRFQSSFFRTAEETLAFIDTLRSEQVGIVLDTFHMNIEESEWEAPLRLAPERVFYIHLADNHRGPPGSGLIPFERVLQALAGIGYDGWASIEIAQTPSPQAAAAKALRGYRTIVQSSSRSESQCTESR